jgi:hypothetical protein
MGYIASNGKMAEINGVKRMWKENVMASRNRRNP